MYIPPLGEPHPVGKLGVLEEGESGRGLVRAEAKVHILERKGGLEARVAEVARRVGRMPGERLHLEHEGQIARAEVGEGGREVAPHEAAQGDVEVAVALLQEAEEAPKRSRLDALELLLHARQIGRQIERSTVVKMDPVGRIEAGEVEVVLHPLAQRRVGVAEHLRHQEKGGAGVECVVALPQLGSATARGRTLLDNRYFVACAGQPARRRQPTNAGSDNYGRWHYPASSR